MNFYGAEYLVCNPFWLQDSSFRKKKDNKKPETTFESEEAKQLRALDKDSINE